MRRRPRPNPRLIKSHFSYTVEEAARALPAHKNTIRRWLKNGLSAIDNRRPTLILGSELRRFLDAQRKKRRRPCAPGQIYCVRCRGPKSPAGDMAEYLSINDTVGSLRGICPDCETLIYRRVALAKIDEKWGNLEVTFSVARSRIRDTDDPFVNSDSSHEARNHENA